MRKLKIVCLCALLSISLLGCTSGGKEKADQNTQTENEVEEINIDDPFAEE